MQVYPLPQLLQLPQQQIQLQQLQLPQLQQQQQQQQQQSSFIPQEAYLYFPQASDMKTKHGYREMYDGNIQFDDSENAKISEFRSYAAMSNYNLHPIWTDGMILRFLYSNQFKMDQTLQNVQSHTQWRQASLPVQLDARLQQLLNAGIFYVCGRDNEFRPIVVFNLGLLSNQNLNEQSYWLFLMFWLEFILENYILPGQVENWVFILDMKGMKLDKATIHNVKQVVFAQAEQYKNRLHSMYIVNVRSAIYVPWKMYKKFLDDDTLSRIGFFKSSAPDRLFTHAHPTQVEQKYGGSAPNFRQFWPPQINMNPVPLTPSTQAKMVTVDTYRNLYKQGALKNIKINPQFIQEEPTAQQTINEPVSNTAQTAEPVIQETYNKPVDNPVGIVEPMTQAAYYEPAANKVEFVEAAKSLEAQYIEDHGNADEITKSNENFNDFSDYSEEVDDGTEYTEYMSEANADSQYATKTKVFEVSSLESCE